MRPTVRAAALVLLAGLPLVGTPAAAAAARAVTASVPSTADPYAGPVAEASQRFGVPAAWIRAVLWHESRGQPHVVSAKGAMGLMQVMPATWAALTARHALGSDPFDPRANILAGAAFLRAMHDRYGSVPAMLAAYSAGPARTDQWLAGRPLPAETRAYLAALVPAIDGGGAITMPVAPPPDPLAWTRAPLFVARSDRAQPTDEMPPERKGKDAVGIVPVRDVAPVPDGAGTLFARSDRGEGR